jgi:hypothetical protein
MYFYDIYDPERPEVMGPNYMPQGYCDTMDTKEREYALVNYANSFDVEPSGTVDNENETSESYDGGAMQGHWNGHRQGQEYRQGENQRQMEMEEYSKQMEALVEINNAYGEENQKLMNQMNQQKCVEGFDAGSGIGMLINIIIFLVLLYIVIKLIFLVL